MENVACLYGFPFYSTYFIHFNRRPVKAIIETVPTKVDNSSLPVGVLYWLGDLKVYEEDRKIILRATCSGFVGVVSRIFGIALMVVSYLEL